MSHIAKEALKSPCDIQPCGRTWDMEFYCADNALRKVPSILPGMVEFETIPCTFVVRCCESERHMLAGRNEFRRHMLREHSRSQFLNDFYDAILANPELDLESTIWRLIGNDLLAYENFKAALQARRDAKASA